MSNTPYKPIDDDLYNENDPRVKGRIAELVTSFPCLSRLALVTTPDSPEMFKSGDMIVADMSGRRYSIEGEIRGFPPNSKGEDDCHLQRAWNTGVLGLPGYGDIHLPWRKGQIPIDVYWAFSHNLKRFVEIPGAFITQRCSFFDIDGPGGRRYPFKILKNAEVPSQGQTSNRLDAFVSIPFKAMSFYEIDDENKRIFCFRPREWSSLSIMEGGMGNGIEVCELLHGGDGPRSRA